MDIRHFLTFKTIVEQGSFIKAAKALNYAQSSITSHIQVIEDYYGQPVFDRLGKKVQLNSFGMMIYERALPLLAHYHDICELKNETEEPSGTLRIGVPESTMLYRLAPILQRYKAEYPSVEIVMLNSLCPVVKQSLKDGDLDLGFLLEREIEDPDIITESLFIEPMSVVLPLTYPKEELDCKAVKESNLAILYTEQGCSYRDYFSALLKEHNIHTDNRIETASVEVIKQYILCSLGFSFLPTIVAGKELEEGKLKHIPWQSDKPIYIQMAYHKDKWLSPAMRVFMRLAQEEVEKWEKMKN
ncbi:MAG: LysR family transcriptional regulator [Desulfovibrio sp.]